MEQLHDKSYHRFFSHPKMVKDLLQGFVQEDWVKDLDFDSLEPVKTKFVSAEWHKREDDVIWRIKWRDHWLYIYILLEFQSTIEPFMAVRFMVYVGLLYQELIKYQKLKKGDKLPPILPIVIYNGESRWDISTRLTDVLEIVPDELAHYFPRLDYLLIDEGCYADEELLLLRELENLVAVLFRMENAKSEEELMLGVQKVRQDIQYLIDWFRKYADNFGIKEDFENWIKRVLLSRTPSVEIPELFHLEEMNSMLAEFVEKQFVQAEQKAFAKGKQEGFDEGKQEGLEKAIQTLTHSIITILTNKFGQLPDSICIYLNQLDEDALSKHLQKAIKITQLDDFIESDISD